MKCPYCAERIKPEAVLCRFCGKSLEAQTPNAFETSSGSANVTSTLLEKRSFPDKVRAASIVQRVVAVIVGLLLLAGLGYGAQKYNEQRETKRIEAQRLAAAKAEAKAKADAEAAELAEYSRALSDNSWVPAGFEKFSLNPYLAYKKDNRSCGGLGPCFPFELVSVKYCQSVYVEANMTRNGVVYDWSNDTAQGVSPGTIVKMKLQYSEDVSNTYTEFTEVNCR